MSFISSDPFLDDFNTEEDSTTITTNNHQQTNHYTSSNNDDNASIISSTSSSLNNDNNDDDDDINDNNDNIYSQLRTQPNYLQALTEIRTTNNTTTTTTSNNDSFDQEQSRVERLNTILAKIDDSIVYHHRKCAMAYKTIFPELEGLLPDPLEYARVILAYGHSDEANDLSSILQSAQLLVVKVSKTNCKSSVKNADQHKLNEALHCAQEICVLKQDRDEILTFLEEKMIHYAPNLCIVIGTRCASLLLGLVGGLEKLSLLPSNLIQNLGRKAKAIEGIITGIPKKMRHAGVLASECPLVTQTPPHLRKRALRTVAGKLTLAARIDFSRRDPGGNHGKEWLEEIQKKIESWKDPGPGKVKKALPVPDAQKPKRRGGKRARRENERRGLTQMHIMANRISMTGNGEEYSLSAMGESTGMLGNSSSTNGGRVRTVQARDTQRLGDKANKKLKSMSVHMGRGGSGGGGISGFTSLAFTPVQGIELGVGTTMNRSSSSSRTSNSSNNYNVNNRNLPPVPLFNTTNNKKN
jgi:U4/U6 small nuclear ribonucleoprotein PRP31